MSIINDITKPTNMTIENITTDMYVIGIMLNTISNIIRLNIEKI